MGQHKRYQNTHSLSSRGEDGEEVAKNKQTKKPNEIITPTMKVYRPLTKNHMKKIVYSLGKKL